MDFLQRWESKPLDDRRSAFGIEPTTTLDDPGSAVPVTPTQAAILASEAEAAPLSPYTITTAYDVTGVVDADLLARAVEETLKAHPVLNTAYQATAAGIESHLMPAAAVEVVRDVDLDTATHRIASEPIDPRTGPCTKAWVLQVANAASRAPDGDMSTSLALVVKTHHVVADGQSIATVAEQVCARYNGGSIDTSDQFRGLVQAGVVSTDEEPSDEALTWWREHLGSATPAHFPPDRPAGNNASRFRGGHRSFRVDEAAWAKSIAAASRESAGPSALLMLAVAAVCGRYSGEWDMVVGLSVSGRRSARLSSTVGPFADSLPIRVELEPTESVSDALARVAAGPASGNLEHEVPFSSLVRALRPRRESGLNPLYNVLVTTDAAGPQALALAGGGSMAPRPVMNDTARVPFQVTASNTPNGDVELRIDYAESMFTPQFIEQLGHDVVQALSDVARGGAVGDLGRRGSAADLGTVNADPAVDVDELFLQSVEVMGDEVAVEKGQVRLTYAEVADRVARLRAELLECGAATALVTADHGPDLVVALLGCLSARVAYVPVSDSLPDSRVEAIRIKAQTDVEIGSSSGGLRVTPHANGAVEWTDPNRPLERAYAMFTSGSTGEPKAVWVGRSALAEHVRAASKTEFVRAGERMLALTSPTFDISIDELLLPLVCGASIVFPEGGHGLCGVSDAAAEIRRGNVDVVHGTPSMMAALFAEGWGPESKIARVVVGGERLSQSMATEVVRRSRDARNVYGPTEATIWATQFRLRDDLAADPPIGTPLPGYLVRLVSSSNTEPVAPREVGHVLIGGPALALGYGEQPALTAEKFVVTEGVRWYDTGDRAKVVDGQIVFLGRSDDQVKVRGHRVELGEYESIASAVAGVGAVAAACDGERVYLLIKGSPDPTVIRGAFSRMPRAIRPDVVAVTADPMPLTSNGKIDRRAVIVAATAGETPSASSSTPAAGADVSTVVDDDVAEFEQWVLELWDMLLQRSVSRTANLFDEGGHSLILARTAAAARSDLGVSLRMSEMYDDPTAAGIALRLKSAALAEFAQGGS
ncbi:AMP-binding protein [Nocardioides sp. NPDC057772]|uniref:AMP-binding protein n=1 Tax=Nocardioides sp. NPDC057772 TaxID=3346245 RepID=UPI00366CE1F1